MMNKQELISEVVDNHSYDKELRALGYVDSGLSGSRGDYFISSYRPGAKKKHKLPPGRVEVHVWKNMFHIYTRHGKSETLSEALALIKT